MTDKEYLEALVYKYEQGCKKNEHIRSTSAAMLERTRLRAVCDTLTMVLDDLTCAPCLTESKKE